MTVRDDVRKRTIVLRKGKRYLARPAVARNFVRRLVVCSGSRVMQIRARAHAGCRRAVPRGAASADTFTVNTTADTAGPAGCPVFCTIRNAISAAAANGTATDDIVVVPAGIYMLNPQLGALIVPSGGSRSTARARTRRSSSPTSRPSIACWSINGQRGAWHSAT